MYRSKMPPKRETPSANSAFAKSDEKYGFQTVKNNFLTLMPQIDAVKSENEDLKRVLNELNTTLKLLTERLDKQEELITSILND